MDHQQFVQKYDTEHPNEATRKKLAEQWEKLSSEEKIILRSQRARRGIKCPICQNEGYFRENCSNGCAPRPRTPDSDEEDSPRQRKQYPSIGILWNVPDAVEMNENRELPFYKQPLNLRKLRKDVHDERDRLKKSDAPIPTTVYFLQADEGYNRSLPELTLHQVMRRLMRLLERKLAQNCAQLESATDQRLLHPAPTKEGEDFFPAELKKFKEYDEYYRNKVAKKKEVFHSYQYLGGLRPVDSTDELFRGSGGSEASLYKLMDNPGATMHGKIGWKSVTSTGDSLAASDMRIKARADRVEAALAKQSSWVNMQNLDMRNINERFEHLVNVLTVEIKSEHEREYRLLSAQKTMTRTEAMKIWEERFSSVDRIMATVQAYGLTKGIEEADFLSYCLEKWRDLAQQKSKGVLSSTSGDSQAHPKKKKKPTTKVKVSSSSSLMSSHFNAYELESQRLEGLMKKRPKSGLKAASMDTTVTSMTTASTVAGGVSAMPSHFTTVSEDSASRLLGDGGRGGGQGGASRPRSTSSSHRRSKHPLPTQSDSLQHALDMAKAQGEKSHYERRHAAEEEARKQEHARRRAKANIKIVHQPNPREIDAAEIKKEKERFRAAGLGMYIRKGHVDDAASLAPTLIPIPKAFETPIEHALSSHTGQNIVDKVQRSLVRGDIGYTSQMMMPLYVRNTLVEKNGSTPGGDQSIDIMAQDRRYSHYMGRPLNRFESDKSLVPTATVNAYGLKIKDEGPPVLTERQLEKIRQKKRDIELNPLTSALVRLTFNKPPDSLADLHFKDDLMSEQMPLLPLSY